MAEISWSGGVKNEAQNGLKMTPKSDKMGKRQGQVMKKWGTGYEKVPWPRMYGSSY